MKKFGAIFGLSALFLMLLAPCLFASTIIGPVYDPFGQKITNNITFKLQTPVVITTNFYTRNTKLVQTDTNGMFSTTLSPGNWTAQVGPMGDIVSFAVPNDTNTYALATLLSSGAIFVTRTSAFLIGTNNLSDIGLLAAVWTNLGFGSKTNFLLNNLALSDLASPTNARTNIIAPAWFNKPDNTVNEERFWTSWNARQFDLAPQIIDFLFNVTNGWANSTNNAVAVTNGLPKTNAANGYIFTNGLACNGSTLEMNHTFVVGTNETARITAYIFAPTNSTASGSALTGVGIATTSNPNGNFGLVGVSFGGNTTNYQAFIVGTNGGASGARYNTPANLQSVVNLTPGNIYKVMITIDPNTVCYVLTDLAHSFENRYFEPRSLWPVIGNVQVYNSDTRGTNGCQVLAVAAKKTYANFNPNTGLEGDLPWIAESLDAAGNTMRIEVPTNYDCKIPTRLIYLAHGAQGNGANEWYDDGGAEAAFYEGIVSNGIIYVASSQDAGGATNDTAGNNVGKQAVMNAVNYGRTNFSVSSIFLLGQSAGGLPTYDFMTDHSVKIDGMIGMFAVWNLAVFDTSSFSGDITAAYGISGGNPAPGAWAGHDPMTNPADLSYNVSMLYIGSPSDSTVPLASNGTLMQTKLAGWQREFTIVQSSGGHGDASNYGTNLTTILNFLDRCALVHH